MRKRWLTLGVLFTGVMALALFVWLKPPKAPAVSHALASISAADAHALRLLRGGKLLAILEKHKAEWVLSEPMKVPADAFQVLRLLAILDAKSASQYPLSDTAKFGLDAPQAEIIINNQRFAFGAINTVTREQYVLTQHAIYPLDPSYGAAVPDNATALFRKSVLAQGDVPIRFEFGAFSVDNDSTKWTLTPPADGLSQDDFNRWVAQWRDGSGLRAEAADSRKPVGDIVITLRDGTKVALGVVQTAPEVILRRADWGLQWAFVGDVGRRMISPPAAPK
jgi:hypothetical protein